MAVVDRPTVPEVLPLVQRYYAIPGNGAGGSLHIVLDDGNLEDSSVQFCRDWALREGDGEGVVLATVLLAMTRSQRARVRKQFWASRREPPMVEGVHYELHSITQDTPAGTAEWFKL